MEINKGLLKGLAIWIWGGRSRFRFDFLFLFGILFGLKLVVGGLALIMLGRGVRGAAKEAAG